MKHNYKLVFLLLVLLVNSSKGYTKPIEKTSFQEAEQAYHENKLTKAEALYLQVLSTAPNHYSSNARLGSLYLGLNQPVKSIAYLKKALELHKGYSPELNLQLSEAYQLSYDFDNAITLYFNLIKHENPNSAAVAFYRKKIDECIAGKQLATNPVKVRIKNLGPLVNSASIDHVPVLTDNDSTMLFTSQRPRAAKKPGGAGDEDIFIISQQPNGWSAPLRLEKPFNTPEHEAMLAVTPDGNTMYFYNTKSRKGDIYESRKEARQWQAPVKLGPTINTKYHELSFVLAQDGNVAFFSSDRPGGYGGLDIYMSISEGNGKWSEAINLGSNINTPYNEDAPFLSSDNNTLYFSSQGHNSMGGYDVFKVTTDGMTWSLAQNLGMPINSPYDDVFYVQTRDGKIAYYTSDRPGGFGESDIYSIVAAGPDPLSDVESNTGVFTAMLNTPDNLGSVLYEPQLAAAPAVQTSVKLKGYVTDALTRDTLVATRLTLIDKTLLSTEAIIETDGQGYFELELEKDKNYGLLIESAGYHFSSRNLLLPAGAADLELQPMLHPVSTPAAQALQNVHFYPNHDYIKSYSLAELDWLYTYLLDNPEVDAIITDYLNPDDTMQYKKSLNKKRAAAVIKYLYAKGLEPGRISYKAKLEEKRPVKDSAATGMVVTFEQVD